MHMGLSAMLSVSSDLYDYFIKTNILMQNLPTGRNSYLSELKLCNYMPSILLNCLSLHDHTVIGVLQMKFQNYYNGYKIHVVRIA